MGLAPQVASGQGYVDHAAHWVDVLRLMAHCQKDALINAKVGTTDGGPGVWERVNESMSDRARMYQEAVTGVPSDIGYRVNGVKFDGFKNGTLIDAKGPGYEKFLNTERTKTLPWYRGGDLLMNQARAQVRAAGDTPVKWIVAEADFAQYLSGQFMETGIPIDVVHRPFVRN